MDSLKNKEKEFHWQKGIVISWASVFVNIFLAFAKGIIGFFANSLALLGDALHSFLDISSDLVTIFGLKMSRKPQDIDYHYGHHKFASLCTFFIAIFLLFLCTTLIYVSLKTLLLQQKGPLPSWGAIGITLVSISFKELLYWRTRYIARQLKSKLLMANAWHHRWDSFSSILVLIAVGSVLFGNSHYYFIDKVFGLLMGGYFGIQSLKLFKQSCDDLLDRAPQSSLINHITEHILPTPGAIGYHDFRMRHIGDMYEVALHLQVDPYLSVEEGHAIASQVKKNILKKHSEVIDVLIHIEPADPYHLKQKGISDFKQSPTDSKDEKNSPHLR